MIELIKKYINKIITIRSFEVGTIIWGKRYTSHREKKEIEEGHKEGPFIIYRQSLLRTYVLSCTSSSKNKLKVKLKENKYLPKCTYAYIGKVKYLKARQFINKMGIISKDDLNNINKVLYILLSDKNYNIENINKDKLKFTIDKNDIIEYKKIKYVVKKKDNKYYYCNKQNSSITKNIKVNKKVKLVGIIGLDLNSI